MKISHVLSVVCLFLVAGFATVAGAQEAEESLKTQVIGKWVVNVEKTLEEMKSSDDMQEPEMEMMKQMLPGMSLNFAKDGSFVMGIKMGGMSQEQNGKYEVKEVDSAKKAVTIAVWPETDESEKSATLTFSSKDDCKMDTDTGDTLFLKRAAEDGDDSDSDDDGDKKSDKDGR